MKVSSFKGMRFLNVLLLSLKRVFPKYMKLQALDKITSAFEATDSMPVLFLGHGSPMNAIEDNEFVRAFKELGTTLARPKAILCISAHWETRGTFVTAMESPRTIHDFGGFPQSLFDVQYKAPGSPGLSEEIIETVAKSRLQLDYSWGLDHGAWSVIKHLYPKADVPVLQLSLDYSQPPQYHYELARELSFLRKKGVLIIGSGNMVHNLRLMAWDKLNEDNFAFDWALEARESMKKLILSGDHKRLIEFNNQGKAFQLAIPTPEHYLPLLYALALKGENESVDLFNDKAMAGSLMMTSLKIGKG